MDSKTNIREQNKENLEIEDYVDFRRRFKKLIEKHKNDENYDLIKDYPKIFSLITNIASDKNSDGIVKVIMNSAISYFILTIDVVPEKEFGIKGYVDDFFISLYALNKLLEYDSNQGEYLISKHWKLDDDYKVYISEKYYQQMRALNDRIIADIIAYSGMGFIEEIILFKQNSKTYSEKKIRILEKQLDYMFHLFFNRSLIGKVALQ
jgi:uncharacterized membrane protein YkvA (DUF1232 family)